MHPGLTMDNANRSFLYLDAEDRRKASPAGNFRFRRGLGDMQEPLEHARAALAAQFEAVRYFFHSSLSATRFSSSNRWRNSRAT